MSYARMILTNTVEDKASKDGNTEAKIPPLVLVVVRLIIEHTTTSIRHAFVIAAL